MHSLVERHTAVDLEHTEVHTGVGLHRIDHIAALVADRLQRRPGHVRIELKRDSPTIAPRASDRQYGANSPEKAGTKYTPPLSSTSAASVRSARRR